MIECTLTHNFGLWRRKKCRLVCLAFGLTDSFRLTVHTENSLSLSLTRSLVLYQCGEAYDELGAFNDISAKDLLLLSNIFVFSVFSLEFQILFTNQMKRPQTNNWNFIFIYWLFIFHIKPILLRNFSLGNSFGLTTTSRINTFDTVCFEQFIQLCFNFRHNGRTMENQRCIQL